MARGVGAAAWGGKIKVSKVSTVPASLGQESERFTELSAEAQDGRRTGPYVPGPAATAAAWA